MIIPLKMPLRFVDLGFRSVGCVVVDWLLMRVFDVVVQLVFKKGDVIKVYAKDGDWYVQFGCVGVPLVSCLNLVWSRVDVIDIVCSRVAGGMEL